MDLSLCGWHGDESFLLVADPEYPMEWFLEGEASEAGRLDIHGGAFETAAMRQKTVPLGYAGNPAGYQAVGKHVEEMLTLQTEDIAKQLAINLITERKAKDVFCMPKN